MSEGTTWLFGQTNPTTAPSRATLHQVQNQIETKRK